MVARLSFTLGFTFSPGSHPAGWWRLLVPTAPLATIPVRLSVHGAGVISRLPWAGVRCAQLGRVQGHSRVVGLTETRHGPWRPARGLDQLVGFRDCALAVPANLANTTGLRVLVKRRAGIELPRKSVTGQRHQYCDPACSGCGGSSGLIQCGGAGDWP